MVEDAGTNGGGAPGEAEPYPKNPLAYTSPELESAVEGYAEGRMGGTAQDQPWPAETGQEPFQGSQGDQVAGESGISQDMSQADHGQYRPGSGRDGRGILAEALAGQAFPARARELLAHLRWQEDIPYRDGLYVNAAEVLREDPERLYPDLDAFWAHIGEFADGRARA